jgi:succinate dehydrogenase/fumarate reductase flavoprotein subunit
MSNINPRWGAWAAPPAPISDGEIKKRLNADVVVIGAGIAGVSCALRAAQTGASVIVLEKTGSWSGRGGNIGVANSSFMQEQGYENDPAAVAREWIKRCGNRCDEKILWKFLLGGGRAMDWLVGILTMPEYGARPVLQGSAYKGETYYEIPGSHRFFDGPMARKGARAGGADAVYAMYSEAVKLGVLFLFNTPAQQLIKREGRVIGAIAKDSDGYLAVNAERGVVLATGDIGGNDEMCEDLAPLANRCHSKIYGPKGGKTATGTEWAYGREDR